MKILREILIFLVIFATVDTNRVLSNKRSKSMERLDKWANHMPFNKVKGQNLIDLMKNELKKKSTHFQYLEEEKLILLGNNVKEIKKVEEIPSWINKIFIQFKFENSDFKEMDYIPNLLVYKLIDQFSPVLDLDDTRSKVLETNVVIIDLLSSISLEQLEVYREKYGVLNFVEYSLTNSDQYRWIVESPLNKHQDKIYGSLKADILSLINSAPKKYNIKNSITQNSNEKISIEKIKVEIPIAKSMTQNLDDRKQYLVNATNSLFWYLKNFEPSFSIEKIKVDQLEDQQKTRIYLHYDYESFRESTNILFRMKLMNRDIKLKDIESINIKSKNSKTRRNLLENPKFFGDRHLDGWIKVKIDEILPLESFEIQIVTSKIVEKLLVDDIGLTVYSDGHKIFSNEGKKENNIFLLLMILILIILSILALFGMRFYIRHQKEERFKRVNMQLTEIDSLMVG